MGQRMMWNNVVNWSIFFVNKLNFVNYISRWKNISPHTTCIKYNQNANTTCDEPIKKGSQQKIIGPI
jgi:hypothetical protein